MKVGDIVEDTQGRVLRAVPAVQTGYCGSCVFAGKNCGLECGGEDVVLIDTEDDKAMAQYLARRLEL